MISIHTRLLVHKICIYLFVCTLVVIVCLPSHCKAAEPASPEDLFAPDMPLRDFGLPADLFAVDFPVSNLGWACGRWGNILHTTDAGKSWQLQNSGTETTLTDIMFIDQTHGWAVGNGGVIVHTTDGGKTWKKQKSPVPFFHMGVYFTNRQRGWIVTERSHILYTDNGGKDWQIQFVGDDVILKSISFVDSRCGWAVGEYGYIYHTRDGGENWEHQAGFCRISYQTGELEAGTTLFDIKAIDRKRAYAVGMDSTLFVTEDAGKRWEKIKISREAIQFFSINTDGNGYMIILGKGKSYESRDYGGSWERAKFYPPAIYGWLYDSAIIGSDFIAVGWNGATYRKVQNKWIDETVK